MNKLILAIITLVSLTLAQDKTFPLCPNDMVMSFDLTGRTLVSTDKLIKKIDNTYSANDRNVRNAKVAIQLCAIDANVSLDSNVITGVSVFTDRFGLARVRVQYSDGSTSTKSLNEIIKRKHELQQE